LLENPKFIQFWAHHNACANLAMTGEK